MDSVAMIMIVLIIKLMPQMKICDFRNMGLQ